MNEPISEQLNNKYSKDIFLRFFENAFFHVSKKLKCSPTIKHNINVPFDT